MSDLSIVLFLDRVFYIMRDYHKKHYTKQFVIDTVIEKLKPIYSIKQHDKTTIQIENELFRIFSHKNYTCFDIEHIGQVKKEGFNNGN